MVGTRRAAYAALPPTLFGPGRAGHLVEARRLLPLDLRVVVVRVVRVVVVVLRGLGFGVGVRAVVGLGLGLERG